MWPTHSLVVSYFHYDSMQKYDLNIKWETIESIYISHNAIRGAPFLSWEVWKRWGGHKCGDNEWSIKVVRFEITSAPTCRSMAIDISTAPNRQARLTPSKVHDYKVPTAPSAAIVARPTSWCPKQGGTGQGGKEPTWHPGAKEPATKSPSGEQLDRQRVTIAAA